MAATVISNIPLIFLVGRNLSPCTINSQIEPSTYATLDPDNCKRNPRETWIWKVYSKKLKLRQLKLSKAKGIRVSFNNSLI